MGLEGTKFGGNRGHYKTISHVIHIANRDITLPLGDINTEAWSSGMGVGRGANNPTL